jgi:hypothetical protein
MSDDDQENWNGVECIVNLVEDIWYAMEQKNLHILDIAELWEKDVAIVNNFLVHDDPTDLTVKDLLRLAAILEKRLIVTFD